MVPPEEEATADICRNRGNADATYDKWNDKYGGLEVFAAKRLKAMDFGKLDQGDVRAEPDDPELRFSDMARIAI